MNIQSTEVREFIGVLVEDIERNGSRISVHILLQATDEEEYHFFDEAPLVFFFASGCVSLAGSIWTRGKRFLKCFRSTRFSSPDL